MRSNTISLAVLALFSLAITGCQSTGSWAPKWDWWRGASNSAPTTVAPLAATAATPVRPSNLAAGATPGTAYPPGVSAPVGGYPNSSYPTGQPGSPFGAAGATTATSNTAPPYSGAPYGAQPTAAPYPNTVGAYGAGTSTAAPASYEATAPNSRAAAPQAGPYNPNAYGQNDPARYTNPNTNPSAAAPTGYANESPYPSTDAGAAAPAAADRYDAPPADGGYSTGSRYDSAAGDRYGNAATGGVGDAYGNAPPTATSNGNAGSDRYGAADSYQAGPAATTADARNAYPTTGDSPANQYVPAGNGAEAASPATQSYRPAGTGTYGPAPTTGSGGASPYPSTATPGVRG